MNSDIDVNVWLDPTYVMPECIYIDIDTLSVLFQWLAKDRQRLQNVASKRWRLTVFKRHLQSLRPYATNRALWQATKTVGIELDEITLNPKDELLIEEIQRAYFHNLSNARYQAELLTCLRKRIRNSHAHIVSQNLSLRRVPGVNTFSIPGNSFVGVQGLPAQFNFFHDMQIHSQLKPVVETQLANGQYPEAVLEACKLLFDHIRKIDPSLTSDGGTLAKDALFMDWKRDSPKKGLMTINGSRPRIELNSLKTTSEGGEQEGYYRFCAGVAEAYRNLTAHHVLTDSFIIKRFGDQQTVLKIIGFVSLVLEKLDARVSP